MSQPIVLSQRIKLPYRYTSGPMHRAGLYGLAEGRLVGSKCQSCGFVTAPARPFCPSCSAAMTETVELEATGRLRSWTVRKRDGVVEATGRIEIGGADNAMLHRLVGDHEWESGMTVAAVWAADGETEITAIEGFEPIEPQFRSRTNGGS